MKTSPPQTKAAQSLPSASVQTSIVIDAEPIDKLRKILNLLGGTLTAESLINEWVTSIVEGERTDCYIRDSVFQWGEWKDSPRRDEIQSEIVRILDEEPLAGLPGVIKTTATTPPAKGTLQPETQAIAARLAKPLHTPLEDIVSMAAHAGIEAMGEAFDRDGEITIPVTFAMRTRDSRAVFLPTDDVALLSDLCTAAGITGGLEGLAAEILGNIAKDSLASDVRKGSHLGKGALDIIPAAWNLGDDHDTAVLRMQDVVDRWNANAGGME